MAKSKQESKIEVKPRKTRLLLGYGCNASCPYCHNEGETLPGEGVINSEFVGKFLDVVPTEEVILSGGEPILNPDIKKIAEEVKLRGIYLSLNTNGSLTSRLGALASLADEIKFNIDTVNIADYETIKKLPYERVYENLLMARERCQNIKINTPFVSIENAASLTDFSLDTGLEVRFIELLYGNLAEPSPKLSQLDGYLRERGYKIHKSGLRKIATKDKSTITLLRCYCREAVLTDDAEQATKLCRANTDLYITPRGELKPCIFGKTRIPIYKSVIDGNIELLQERFDDFDTLFGYGLCLDAIAERQYEKRAAQYV